MAKQYPLEPLFGKIITPFEAFLSRTTAGGIILMGTTLVTLFLANLVGESALQHVWHQHFSIQLGEHVRLDMSIHHWVNDGLMTLFFLIVGLELKREMLVGELSSLREATLPVIAAVGGMLVPAGIYAAFNHDSPTASGWGIPMATDIAFAIGILVLLGNRIPRNLIIFLTALAIADDLGAVLVIALFYTHHINTHALGIAGALIAILLLFNRGGVRHPLPYWFTGLLLWFAVLSSGIHATLAGVVLAFMIPARPKHSPQQFDQRMGELRDAFHEETLRESLSDAFSNHRLAAIAESTEHAAKQVQSPLQRIEHTLTPWVTFLVIPIFALSNAGIDLAQFDIAQTLQAPVTAGILLGLVCGKFIGITLFCFAAAKLGVAQLPKGVGWKQLMGAAWLAGIGFTMSLFIGQLAFTDPLHVLQAKLAVLLASALAAVIGLSWLLWATASPRS
jgi:Na+:H+ antiporter, NhaA family